MELSLLATGVSERSVVRKVPWREGGSPVSVLPAAALFGANGSGKSSVLKAMDDMRTHVLHSFRHGDPAGGMPRRPFLLDSESRVNPTRFEVDLVVEGVRHEYGFTFDNERVCEEWAFRFPKGRAALLFQRDGDDIEVGGSARQKSRAVQELLRPNALFLSTAASANHPDLLPLYLWFSRNLLLAEAHSRPYRQALTTQMIGDDRWRGQVLALLQAADLGVTGAKKHEPDPIMQERLRRAVRILSGVDGEPETDEGPSFEELGVRLTHRGTEGDVELDAEDESLGTRVWFGLIGPVVRALESGSVFLADELDASLHPALVAELIRLFQDETMNPRRAQMIFNTHDASLLGDAVGERLLGRDQIWFTEKNNDGATRLYSLADLEPRKQEAVGRRYLAGRYGAMPILSHAEFAAAAELIAVGDR
jgi:energy-coupling factor transporter ATP-binding protein EcfA2